MSPISFSAGRFVGRSIPKIVGVGDGGLGARGLPLLLDRGGLSSTCRLGVTPAVITLVWNHPAVARGPRRIGRGVEDETDLIVAADVEVVADDLLEEDPTRDRCVEHLVRENSAYRIERSRQWPAARSAAVNGCGESGQPLARQRIDIRWPQPVADRLHRRGDGIVGFSPRPNGNGIRIWWRKKNQNRSDGRKHPGGHFEAGLSALGRDDPDYGSTPSRRSPKPPESRPCFARSTGFRSVGRPRTDRTPLTPIHGVGGVRPSAGH